MTAWNGDVGRDAENAALKARVEELEKMRECSEEFANVEEVALLARVKKLEDQLDLNRDEFQRITSCPGANAEIVQLCRRSPEVIEQNVPVITQRDEAQARVEELEEQLSDYCDGCHR